MAGDGGVGIIRLSGDKSLQLAKEIVEGLDRPTPRYLHRVVVKDNEGHDIDDGLGVFFEAGASFTGEEVVELQLHGGRFTLRKVLRFLMAAGARLALPGEFTFRAVRNGKMNLNQAQALNQFIHAKSQYEAWSARKSLSANRVEVFELIAEKMRRLLALLELSIDFIDQDVEVLSPQSFEQTLLECENSLAGIYKQVSLSKKIALGLSVAFYGKPNAGKSTLFNGLLSEDRAIVSEEPGTTRDVITEELELGPYRVRLGDTAGIREGAATLEEKGIHKTRRLVTEADLKILLIDSSSATVEQTQESYRELRIEAKPDVLVLTKLDLLDALKIEKLRNAFSSENVRLALVSGTSGEGLSELLNTMQQALDEKFGLGLEIPLPTELQLTMLEQCASEVQKAKEVFKVGSAGQASLRDPEILAAILRRAVNALSQIVGETSADDILIKIFSEFCIGK